MHCAKARKNFVLLLDSRLKAREEGFVNDHLAGCPRCRAELARLRKQAELLQRAPQFCPPAELWQRIETRLNYPEPAHPFIVWQFPYRKEALALAAGLLIALSAWVFWPGRDSEQEPVPPSARETEELDILLTAHKTLEFENPLSGGVSMVSMLAYEDNGNGSFIQ